MIWSETHLRVGWRLGDKLTSCPLKLKKPPLVLKTYGYMAGGLVLLQEPRGLYGEDYIQCIIVQLIHLFLYSEAILFGNQRSSKAGSRCEKGKLYIM